MTKRKQAFWTVDRFEDGDRTILERDDGETFVLPRSWLPDQVREGTVLRLELSSEQGSQESFKQLTFTVDTMETERRWQDRRDQRQRLPRAPEGDIEL